MKDKPLNSTQPLGRAATMRTLMAADRTRSWTAAELAVDMARHEATITTTQVLSALNDMYRRGFVERLGKGRGVRWQAGDAPMPEPRDLAQRRTDYLAPAAQPTRLGPLPRNPDLARDAIARDIAAFHARGGKVQVLGPTQLFGDPTPAANQPIPGPRSPQGRRRSAGISL
ncbi:hypothetical protein WCE55_02350 [Luteimonas sp. MJ293]|uniref:hypothetical protein n=1 Tax=Luteimonas sp. MJ146 TaxID=3129240 RepID=UPI0031BAE75A